MADMAEKKMDNPHYSANLGHFGGRSNMVGQKYLSKEFPIQIDGISIVVVVVIIVGVVNIIVVFVDIVLFNWWYIILLMLANYRF